MKTSTYDYIDNNPSSVAPREHKEVQLSGHSPDENPLLGTSGAESPVKRLPQARPLPPIPQIEKDRKKMEENSKDNVTCLRMLQSETQNPNFQTPDEGSRGNILEAGQDIPLDIEKNTCLTRGGSRIFLRRGCTAKEWRNYPGFFSGGGAPLRNGITDW